MGWKSRSKKLEKALKKGTKIQVPDDPVEFCREWLGYEPYPYMHDFLRDTNHFIGVLQARQTGKSFNGTAKLLTSL